MQERVKRQPNHWMKYVDADREPDQDALVGWDNGFDRKELTFDALVENGTPYGRYAYDYSRNRLTAQDKYAMNKNASRGTGQYKSSRDDGRRGYDRDDKRQRRGY